MENQALTLIKRYRSTGFKVWLYINTMLSIGSVLAIIFGTHELPWYANLAIFICWVCNIAGIERRYTAIHNPSKIYKEVNND